jgi:hypothetical protein
MASIENCWAIGFGNRLDCVISFKSNSQSSSEIAVTLFTYLQKEPQIGQAASEDFGLTAIC